MEVVTLKDLAKELGLSETTISLSFQPGSRISDETRKKVTTLAEETGYVPNIAARNLRIKNSKTIGIVVPDLTDQYFASIAEKAESQITQLGYQSMIIGSQWDPGRELSAIHTFIQMKVSGVLLCSTERSGAMLELLENREIPYLFLDTAPADYQGSAVINDFQMIGQIVAEHLLAAGCRAPAMITAKSDRAGYSSLNAMRESFLQYLSDRGFLRSTIPVLEAGFSIEEGRRAAEQLFRENPPVDGIFCINDYLAMGVMEQADAIGRRPGKDLAVVGVDDHPASGLSRLSLSSVKLPLEKMVQRGVEALFNVIEEDVEVSCREVLVPELIVRGSSRLEE